MDMNTLGGFPDHENLPKTKNSVEHVTPFEARLLQALRAFPDRASMWLTLGPNLIKNHQKLLALYSTFFYICNKHNIEYWLEYGSLLGYVRHRGISPWEWDMDVGTTPENYQKLLEIGAEYEKNDPVYGFNFYHDPDYAQPGFSFYLKEDPMVLCDITKYEDTGDGELECSVKEWNYPRYKKADIFPLRRVLCLGQAAWVPNRAEGLLSKVETILGQCTGSATEKTNLNKIPYMQFDPVPFLITHLLQPVHAETLCCKHPTKDVPEASSIAEGFASYGARGMPFVVRGASTGFRFDYESAKRRAEEHGITTFAYDKVTLETVSELSLSQAFAEWERGDLRVNFLDSPVPTLLDAEDVDPHLMAYEICSKNLMMVLSPNHAYTRFHVDPVTKGGGWMYLSRGKKVWNLINYTDLDPIIDDEKKVIKDLPIDELLYVNEHSLWGRIHQAYIEAGDFLYFPPGFAHRVWTYEASVGLGGYAALPNDKDIIPKVASWMEAKGVQPYNGLWNPVEAPQ